MPKVLPEYNDIMRLKIAQAAFKVFSLKGYHNSKMDDIAEEAGLSKPTLYKYVKSKEDLLKLFTDSNSQMFEMLLLSEEDKDTYEIFNEIYNVLLEYKRSFHLAFEVTSLSSHDLEIQKLNRESYKKKIEFFSKILENQQNKGLLKKEIDPVFTAQLLMAIFTDIITQLIIGCDESEVLEYMKKSLSAVLDDKNI